jgi:AraC-like DNA-binding protein
MNITIKEIKVKISESNWFKNPDLDSWMLSQKLGLPEDELNELIKRESGMLLKDFLNELRIELVKLLLDKTIIFERPGYYYKYSGFKSRTPFERHFKSITGMTVQQYILALRAQNKKLVEGE